MTPKDGPARRTSARGLRRRTLLLDAAAELLMTSGFAAVTHRAVAQHAEMPLSATTYYFESLDHLIEGAMRQLAERWLAGADAVVAKLPRQLDDPQALAEALIQVAASGPAGESAVDSRTLLSLYERYVEAVRHPRLRPVVAEYNNRIEVLLGDVLQRCTSFRDETTGELRRTARLVLAVIDGALLRALAEGRHVTSATTTVEHLLTALRADPAGSGP